MKTTTILARRGRQPRIPEALLCAIVLGGILARATIIDRIAVTVADQVITLSQVVEEIRVTAFLNGQQPDLSPDSRRNTAERLVNQTLIRREMEFDRYQAPSLSDTDSLMQQVKSRYTSEDAFQEALQKADITEEQLRQDLLWQLTTLRFTDYRFRPGVQVTDQEIQEYYNAHRNELAPPGQSAPPLDRVHGQIEELLTEERVDQALDHWLQETRDQTAIRYHQEAFQ